MQYDGITAVNTGPPCSIRFLLPFIAGLCIVELAAIENAATARAKF